jgi:hypothetical protein
MKSVKLLIMLALAPMLMAAGCEQRYRYACQNPENWAEEYCQRPLCEVNRDCPDLIIEDLAISEEPTAVSTPTSAKTGECK